MLKILALVVTVALGDSLNRSTIGPALFIASGKRARIAVLEFTLAVFVVHFAGGAILLLGPGHLLLSLVNKLAHTTRDALELAAGLALLLAGAVIWNQRHRLAQKTLPSPNPQRKSSILLGATIIAIELPTAFPYFAAITPFSVPPMTRLHSCPCWLCTTSASSSRWLRFSSRSCSRATGRTNGSRALAKSPSAAGPRSSRRSCWSSASR